MPGFQLLLGENSNINEIIPEGLDGGVKGQAKEKERKTIDRRELVYGFPQHLCPNSKLQNTQAEKIASLSQYGAPWWDSLNIKSTPIYRAKFSQTILTHQ